MPQAVPGKGFSGAAKGTSRPWKTHFQGRVKALPAPENPFSGAANALTRPLKTHLQGRALYLPLEISICSSERQGRVSRPPLKMLFYPPLQTVSVVVEEMFDVLQINDVTFVRNLCMLQRILHQHF